MPVLVGVLVVLATAGVALWWLRSVDVLIRRQTRRQVVIELHTGESFRGLLVAADARSILLRSAEVIGPNQSATVPVDGELLVPRADVKFLQRP